MGEAKRRRERLGDAPIEDRYREQMNAIAQALDDAFNGSRIGGKRKTGFVLLVDRRDIVTLFKEQIKRFEGQPDVKGTA